ncbi:uncharacterized protein [Periplaneta americana]|uniref:uncharacterized protein n=1 Tax=Periplaneta americana TaxID=6978 RepID=UPI0037E9A667
MCAPDCFFMDQKTTIGFPETSELDEYEDMMDKNIVMSIREIISSWIRGETEEQNEYEEAKDMDKNISTIREIVSSWTTCFPETNEDKEYEEGKDFIKNIIDIKLVSGDCYGLGDEFSIATHTEDKNGCSSCTHHPV